MTIKLKYEGKDFYAEWIEPILIFGSHKLIIKDSMNEVVYKGKYTWGQKLFSEPETPDLYKSILNRIYHSTGDNGTSELFFDLDK